MINFNRKKTATLLSPDGFAFLPFPCDLLAHRFMQNIFGIQNIQNIMNRVGRTRQSHRDDRFVPKLSKNDTMQH